MHVWPLNSLNSVNFDVLHALENFLAAYDDETSVVVLEAIANALDANATRVDVKMANQHISFRDNGPGMNKKQFNAYHDISASNKQKGKGIGFAGVGAKVYIGVWNNTVIHTETYGRDGPHASDLRVIHGEVVWEECPTSTSIRTRGTLYKVKLRVRDYEKLSDGINDVIRDHFNSALLDGLKVTINGNMLGPWDPPHEYRTKDVIKTKKLKFPAILTVCRDAVQPKYRHVQYQVWGKTVTTRKLEWAAEIKERYRDRVHCMVRADACSMRLKLDKSSFQGGPGEVADMYRAVDKWLHETLRRKGYVDARGGNVQRNASVTAFFRSLFKDPEYRWLNPGAAAGSGAGAGTGAGGNGRGRAARGDTAKPRNKAKRTRSTKSRRGTGGGSGVNIALSHRADDRRDGWIDPETNNFVCNTAHPLYRKYARNAEARNLRVKQVMFGALIAHGAKSRKVSVAEAFDIQRDLMTRARNLKAVK